MSEDYLNRLNYGEERDKAIFLRFKGNAANIKRLLDNASGPVDTTPVDFGEWANSLVPFVREGLDPIEIEQQLVLFWQKQGIDDPLKSIKETMQHIKSTQSLEFSKYFGNKENHSYQNHGLALPGWVINPEITREDRCNLFIQMVDDLQWTPDQLRFDPIENSSFSFAKLIPMNPAEAIPTWISKNDPWRELNKAQIWNCHRALTNARLNVISDREFTVMGIIEGTLVNPTPYRALIKLCEEYDVKCQAISWGSKTSFQRGGFKSSDGYGRNFKENELAFNGQVVSVTEVDGVRSLDQLTQQIRYNRHERAEKCFLNIEKRIDTLTVGDVLIKSACAGIGGYLQVRNLLQGKTRGGWYKVKPKKVENDQNTGFTP